MQTAYVLRRYPLSVEDISPIFLRIDDLVTYTEQHVFGQPLSPFIQDKLNKIRAEQKICDPILIDEVDDRIWIECIWIECLDIFSSLQDWENSEF